MVLILVLAMLAGVPLVTNAADALIVFGNGVNNDEDDARHSKNALENIVRGDARFAGYTLDFDYAYNQTACIPEDGTKPSDSCIGDIYEAVKQTLTSINDQKFWEYFYRLRSEPQEEFEWFMETANTTPSTLEEVSLRTEDLVDHVTLYKDSIGAGKRVVLVAHSQGNLFGNEAYRFLNQTERASFGMVSVATPTARVLEDSNYDTAPYTTLCEDPIHLVTLAFVPNLSNFVNGCGSADSTPPVVNWFYHGFVSSYLAKESNSLNQIKGDIEYVLESLLDKFAIGDRVEVAIQGTILVWDAPDGNLIGYHEYEDQGVVVNGPRYSEQYKTWMWQVNFDNDPDGWVPETLLRKAGAGVPTGTITVSPNSPCEIPLYGSGCPVTVTWETSNASSPQVKVNGTNQWSTANGVQTISLPVGIHSFGLFDGETGLAEQGGYAVRCQDGLVWDESLFPGASGHKCFQIAKAKITFMYEGAEPDQTKSCIISEGKSTCVTRVTLTTTPGASEPGLIRVADGTLITYAEGTQRTGLLSTFGNITIPYGETKFKAVDEKGTGSDILLMASDPLTGHTIERTAQAYCAAGLVWDESLQLGDSGKKCLPIAKAQITFGYEGIAPDAAKKCRIREGESTCTTTVTLDTSPGASEPGLIRVVGNVTVTYADGLERAGSKNKTVNITIPYGETEFKAVDEKGTGSDILLMASDPLTGHTIERTAQAYCAAGLVWDANPAAGEVQKCIPMAKSDIRFSYEPFPSRDYEAFCEIAENSSQCTTNITASVSAGTSEAKMYKRYIPINGSNYVPMLPLVKEGTDRNVSATKTFGSITLEYGETRFKIIDENGLGADIELLDGDDTITDDPAARTARARCAPGLTFDYAANPQRCRNIIGPQ